MEDILYMSPLKCFIKQMLQQLITPWLFEICMPVSVGAIFKKLNDYESMSMHTPPPCFFFLSLVIGKNIW